MAAGQKTGIEITDNGFFSTPDDVLKRLDEMRITLKAAGMLLQKKVQMRIPTDKKLVPRNVILTVKKNSAKIEILPYIKKRKGGLKRFLTWVCAIEYRESPFLRPAFDETVNEIVDMFNMKLGQI